MILARSLEDFKRNLWNWHNNARLSTKGHTMAFPDKAEQLRILKVFLECYPTPLSPKHPFVQEMKTPTIQREIAYLLDSKLLTKKVINKGRAKLPTWSSHRKA